jgi:putative addiction module component (TIGR02574 family)
MTERGRILIEQAKLLSAEEREEIIEALLVSFGELSPASNDAVWKLEIDRRLSAIGRGEEQTEDFETALADLRADK